MDKGNHENTLKEINEYLLSFFQFAAQSASTEFQESEWIAFAGIPGKWLYLVYKMRLQKMEKKCIAPLTSFFF